MIQLHTPEEWIQFAEELHFRVFGEYRPKELNRIDYVLTAWNDQDLIGYMTLKEADSETIYIGYGGVLPQERKTFHSVQAFNDLLGFLKTRYVRATTLIENKNIPMLKMYFKAGFLVTGIKNFKNIIYLELSHEWGTNG